MKLFFKTLILIAVSAMGVVACEEVNVDEPNIEFNYKTTLTAATPTSPETRVEFSENDETSEIDLKWEVDDEFTVYNNDGIQTGIFTCTDAENGTFSSESTLTEGTIYTAKYNENGDLSSQNGDEINNLDAACQMEAAFIYGDGETITFEHQMAIMTFEFESAVRPAKLVFENGDDIYTVTYSEIEPSNGVYTSHIMIEPCEVETRTLTFSLYATEDAEEEAYDIRTVETSKAYLSGYRYTASVSNLENIAWSGTGTESDPYQIETADQLRNLATKVNSGTNYEGKFFEMMNDIDLGGEDNEFTAIGTYSTSFKGSFNGGNYKVSGLYINQSESYQGLFGCIYSATIKNISVSGSVTGAYQVGGIVGCIIFSTVDNCYNEAKVHGTSADVGGIVGWVNSPSCYVTNCYNIGDISGEIMNIGGIIGYMSSTYTYVINCYNTGNISCTVTDDDSTNIGGIVGMIAANNTVDNCYSTGNMSGGASYIGGVVGQANSSSIINNCYYDSTVYSGGQSYDGVTGVTTNEMQAESFVTELNNNAFTYNESDTTGNAACAWIVVSNDYPALDFDNSPTFTRIATTCIDLGSGTELDPYQIENSTQLLDLATTVNASTNYEGKYFKLTSDIDLGDEAWTPIGTGTTTTNAFGGIFDGDDHSITGLYVNGSSVCQGLFGSVYNGTIKNLYVGGEVTYSATYQHTGLIAGLAMYATFSSCTTLEGSSVSGGNNNVAGIAGYAKGCTFEKCTNNANINSSTRHVGGIAGYCSPDGATAIISCSNTGAINSSNCAGGIAGTFGSGDNTSYIINCSNNGSVKVSSQYAGGLIGVNQGGAIYNSYNTGTIECNDCAGGLVGSHQTYNSYSAIMSNCYTSGSTSGSTNVGLVVGLNDSSIITSCYYDNSNSGSAIGSDSGSSEITSMTTSDMQSKDFITTLNNDAYSISTACAWVMVSSDYPALDFDAVPTFTKIATSCTEVGSGTESDPYKIDNATQLRDLATTVNAGENYSSKYFLMTNNIYLGGEDDEFPVIGNSNNTFNGTFNGDYYTISGLYISGHNGYEGLFGCISGATIENLKVSGNIVKGGMFVGGIVGQSSGSIINNCSSNVTIGSYNSGFAGGIAGLAIDNSIIINCCNTASIESNYDAVSGIASVQKSYIVNCYNIAEKVSGASDSYEFMSTGGIAGHAVDSEIFNCYSSAEVYITYNGVEYEFIPSAESHVGSMPTAVSTESSDHSIIGWNSSTTVSNCYAYSNYSNKSVLNSGVSTYNATNPSIKACTWKLLNGYAVFDWQ
ncbi:MAG: GLUG motif-containing protein [Rikenellaceae bacterium]